MMKWLREWNRWRYDPSFRHLSRTESARDGDRRAFEKFYKGWRDYLEGQPMFVPPNWDEAARQWYHSGYEKAQTEGPAKELATTGQELPRYLYSPSCLEEVLSETQGITRAGCIYAPALYLSQLMFVCHLGC